MKLKRFYCHVYEFERNEVTCAMSMLHKLLISIVLVSVTWCAAAEESGFYFGGSVGYSNFDTDKSDISAALPLSGLTGTVVVDENDLGWKSFFGYNFNKYLGLEGAYVDLGEIDGDFRITTPPPDTGKSVQGVDGFTVLGVGRYPIREQLDVFAKVGAFFWNVDNRINLSGGGTTATIRHDEDGTDLVFGSGVRYEFMEHLSVRAEWERYSDVGDDDSDVDLFTIGLQFNF